MTPIKTATFHPISFTNPNKLDDLVKQETLLKAKIEKLRKEKISHIQYGTGNKTPIKKIHALEKALESIERQKKSIKSPFRKEHLTPAQTQEKMIKNLIKAQNSKLPFEHLFPEGNRCFNPKASISGFKSKHCKENSDNFLFNHKLSTNKLLIGVLSGEKEMGFLAQKIFLDTFSGTLNEIAGHTHLAFEITTAKIQQTILKTCKPNQKLCTGVFSVFDFSKSSVITATIGNCNATCYRTHNQTIIPIQLSLPKDWTSASEENRARLFMENTFPSQTNLIKPHLKPKNHQSINPNKYTSMIKTYKDDGCVAYDWDTPPERPLCRYLKDPRTKRYFNVSRSFGHENSPIIPKPKITQSTILRGDVFVISNPEFKLLPESSVINEITKEPITDLASRLAFRAYHGCNTDNYIAAGIVTIK